MINLLSILTLSRARCRACNSAENIHDLSGRCSIEEELSMLLAAAAFHLKENHQCK